MSGFGKKGTFTSIVCVSILLTMLAGCAAPSASPSGTAQAPAATTAAQSNEPKSDAPDAGGDAGEEFSYPMDKSAKLTYWLELNGNVSPNFVNLGETPFAIELENRTGIVIEYQHPPAGAGAAKEQLNLMIASKTLPDMVEYNWLKDYVGGPEKAIADQVILRLNDVLTQYNPNFTNFLAERPAVNKQVMTDEGSYYVFPHIRDGKLLLTSEGAYMRQDWLDKVGKAMPETLDEWYDVLSAFKNELGATAPFSYNYNVFKKSDIIAFAHNIGTEWYIGDDNKIHYGPYEAAYKDYLTVFAKWYDEDLIDPDIATLTQDQVNAKMTSGQAGVSMGWAGSTLGTLITTMADDPDFALVGCPYPTLNKGDYPEMGHADSEYVGVAVAISTSCENVEAAARYLDYAYGEEGRIYYNFGQEDISFTWVDGFPTYTDSIYNHPEGWPLGQSLAAYIRGNYAGPMPQDERYIMQYFPTEAQSEAYLGWAKTNGADHAVPPITATPDESDELAMIMNEISAYVGEMTLQYILGKESLDSFDNYLATLQKMEVERAIEIRNAGLERYQAR